MKPSVADIVHYVSYGTPGGEYTSQCRAAIITAVHDKWYPDYAGEGREQVDLFVMNPEGIFLNKNAIQDESEKKGGTWHWPESVEE